jgi:Cu/Ag efflux protein CusF
MKSSPAAIALLGLTLLVVGPATGHAAGMTVEELPLAAAPGSATPSLTGALDGSIFVAWTEMSENGDHETALRFAQFDRETQRWFDPQTIAAGENWLRDPDDSPVIAAGLRGRLAAAWYVKNTAGGYHARVSQSEDGGQTWSAPARLTTESERQKFVQLVPLLNGSWLALWLDGRDAAATQLRSRVIGDDAPDALVDDRVSDCGPLSSLVLPNGVVLTAYRDRSATEVRDIAYRAYSRGDWEEVNAPTQDGWQTEDCPVSGAHLARRSGNVAAAWFTGANHTPQVWVARSNNLGRSWNSITRVDDPDQPAMGAPQVVVLRDGTHWISWLEAGRTLALRALHREGAVGEVHRLAGPTEGRAHVRVLNNRADQAAQLLIVHPRDGRVVTDIATLPFDGEPTIDDCGCSPAEAARRGHPVTGEIVSLLPDRDALLVAHEEVPGVMRAMTMAFQVDPKVLDVVRPGQRITGRMERRADGKWWFFSIRIVRATN